MYIWNKEYDTRGTIQNREHCESRGADLGNFRKASGGYLVARSFSEFQPNALLANEHVNGSLIYSVKTNS